MKRLRSFTLFMPLLAITALVACTNTPVQPNPGRTPNGGCAVPEPPTLLYPQDGATGIPPAHLTLYFAYPSLPLAYSPPGLTPSSGTSVLTGTPYSVPSPGPMPPGSATPPPGDQVFVSQFNPGVASATTYTVSVTNSSCSQSFTKGTFTTQ